jgi:hypothetical protein
VGVGVASQSLPQLADQVRPVTLAGEQTLPVLPALEALLPGGLQRGTTVAVSGSGGSGAMSLALALLAAPSVAGSWTAAVGLPSLGLLAADDLGVALERFAMVATPGTPAWATVVAALVDAFDMVILGGTHRLRPGDGRRLAARARERGAVLVPVGGRVGRTGGGLEADVRLTVVDASWHGVGDGHGHLQARRVVVEAEGRRAAARSRRAELWLPDAKGAVAAAEPAEPMAAVRRLRVAG